MHDPHPHQQRRQVSVRADAQPVQQTVQQLPPSLQKIVGAFQIVPDPMARYKQLLFYAAKLPKMAAEDHVPDNKVEGCVSQVGRGGCNLWGGWGRRGFIGFLRWEVSLTHHLHPPPVPNHHPPSPPPPKSGVGQARAARRRPGLLDGRQRLPADQGPRRPPSPGPQRLHPPGDTVGAAVLHRDAGPEAEPDAEPQQRLPEHAAQDAAADAGAGGGELAGLLGGECACVFNLCA